MWKQTSVSPFTLKQLKENEIEARSLSALLFIIINKLFVFENINTSGTNIGIAQIHESHTQTHIERQTAKETYE